MEWLEGLGLLGLFIGTFLAATIFPFSSDALYLAILAATANPIGCLLWEPSAIGSAAYSHSG